MESAASSQKVYHPHRWSTSFSQVTVERLMIFIILPVMTGIIALRRLSTFRFKPSKKQYHNKHRKYNPPTSSRLSSKWKPLRNVIIWLTIFCEPTLRWKSMVNGLPPVTETNEMMLPSTTNFPSSGIIEHQADEYFYKQNQEDDVNDAVDSQILDDITDGPLEFTASFNSYNFLPSQNEHKFGIRYVKSKKPEKARLSRESNRMMIRPRRKKGLSFLSKYYSQAIPNNTNSNNIFGINPGFTNNSGEQRFPSVRRKLSFYPPLTLMNPRSRAGTTGSRSANMRLRWGK